MSKKIDTSGLTNVNYGYSVNSGSNYDPYKMDGTMDMSQSDYSDSLLSSPQNDSGGSIFKKIISLIKSILDKDYEASIPENTQAFETSRFKSELSRIRPYDSNFAKTKFELEHPEFFNLLNSVTSEYDIKIQEYDNEIAKLEAEKAEIAIPYEIWCDFYDINTGEELDAPPGQEGNDTNPFSELWYLAKYKKTWYQMKLEVVERKKEEDAITAKIAELKEAKVGLETEREEIKKIAKNNYYSGLAGNEDFEVLSTENIITEVPVFTQNFDCTHLTEEEGKILTYLNNKYGMEVAVDYYRTLERMLIFRKGYNDALTALDSIIEKDADGNYIFLTDENGNYILDTNGNKIPKLKEDGPIDELLAAKFGFEGGIDNFWNGIENRFIEITSKKEQTAEDIEKLMIMNYLVSMGKENEKIYGISSSIGNIAIPLVISTLVQMATKNPTAARAVYSTLSYLSSSGNSIQKAVEEMGMSYEEAYFYGVLSAGTETTLELLIGDIPGLKSNTKLSSLLIDAVSEAGEEELQYLASVYIDYLVTGELNFSLDELLNSADSAIIISLLLGSGKMSLDYVGKKINIDMSNELQTKKKAVVAEATRYILMKEQGNDVDINSLSLEAQEIVRQKENNFVSENNIESNEQEDTQIEDALNSENISPKTPIVEDVNTEMVVEELNNNNVVTEEISQELESNDFVTNETIDEDVTQEILIPNNTEANNILNDINNELLNDDLDIDYSDERFKQLSTLIQTGQPLLLEVNKLQNISQELVNYFFENNALNLLYFNYNGRITNTQEIKNLIKNIYDFLPENNYTDIINKNKIADVYFALNQKNLDFLMDEYFKTGDKANKFLDFNPIERKKVLNQLTGENQIELLHSFYDVDKDYLKYLIRKKEILPSAVNGYLNSYQAEFSELFNSMENYEKTDLLKLIDDVDFINQNLWQLAYEHEKKNILKEYSNDLLIDLYNLVGIEEKRLIVNSLSTEQVIALQDIINYSYLENINFNINHLEIYNSIKSQTKLEEYFSAEKYSYLFGKLKNDGVDISLIIDNLSDEHISSIIDNDGSFLSNYGGFLNNRLENIITLVSNHRKLAIIEGNHINQENLKNIFSKLQPDEIQYLSDRLEVSLKWILFDEGVTTLNISKDDINAKNIFKYVKSDMLVKIKDFFGELVPDTVLERIDNTHHYWSQTRFWEEYGVNNENVMAFNSSKGSFYDISYVDYVLKSTIVHESMHELSRTSIGSGFYGDAYKGINECVTELFAELIMEEEYPTNIDGKLHCGYQMGVEKLKIMLKNDIFNLEDLKKAYVSNDNKYFESIFKNEQLSEFLELFNGAIDKDKRKESLKKLDDFILDYLIFKESKGD